MSQITNKRGQFVGYKGWKAPVPFPKPGDPIGVLYKMTDNAPDRWFLGTVSTTADKRKGKGIAQRRAAPIIHFLDGDKVALKQTQIWRPLNDQETTAFKASATLRSFIPLHKRRQRAAAHRRNVRYSPIGKNKITQRTVPSEWKKRGITQAAWNRHRRTPLARAQQTYAKIQKAKHRGGYTRSRRRYKRRTRRKKRRR